MCTYGGYETQMGKQVIQACSTMWATLRMSQVWQPTLFMYLSWALLPNVGEGLFYWFNDKEVGPGFSQVLPCGVTIHTLALQYKYLCLHYHICILGIHIRDFVLKALNRVELEIYVFISREASIYWRFVQSPIFVVDVEISPVGVFASLSLSLTHSFVYTL